MRIGCVVLAGHEVDLQLGRGGPCIGIALDMQCPLCIVQNALRCEAQVQPALVPFVPVGVELGTLLVRTILKLKATLVTPLGTILALVVALIARVVLRDPIRTNLRLEGLVV